jgi:hypothetical protein
MRGLAATMLVAAILTAGCSGSAGDNKAGVEEDANFDDIDVKVTKTTGVILGIVVDDRIVPVEGAEITVSGANVKVPPTTSDAQGRFVFQDLPEGTYFLQVKSLLHQPTQTTAEVVAGVEDPPLTRVQLVRLFTQDPYTVQIVKEGFFECTLAAPVNAPWYASAMCVDFILGPVADAYPAARNLTTQAREWHADVGPGWQSIVVEMTWEPSAQGTSDRLGIVLSTYKPTRDKAHSFANVASGNPLWLRLNVGEPHETAASVEPTMIPAEGMQNMSYFVGVRTNGLTSPVAAALNQDFTVYIHMFHNAPLLKEDWSFVKGDEPPF